MIRTYVLVHGAWHGSWCWQRIANKIMSLGHKVLAPDLPGHGENHMAANQVTFNLYVEQITKLVQQQTEPVTLIGHSMAGLVISQVADRIPTHIDKLIYLAAFVPQQNKSLLDIAQQFQSRGLDPFLDFNKEQGEIRLKLVPELIPIFFNRCNETDTKFAMSKLSTSTQALEPFTYPVNTGPSFNNITKQAIVCRYDNVILPADQLRMCQAVTDDIHYIDADHSAYYSADDTVTKLLLQ
jgi:pimeloyl-ACP methyl ester carboxylesterase